MIWRCSVRSTFWNPGPVSRLRSSLPKVPDGTAVNAALLNHWSTVSGPLVSPETLGRPVIAVSTLLLLWFTVNGRPERLV